MLTTTEHVTKPEKECKFGGNLRWSSDQLKQRYVQGWNCRGEGGVRTQEGSTPQLSFQPPYSPLFFNYQDFSRALLTLPVIFRNFNTGYVEK